MAVSKDVVLAAAIPTGRQGARCTPQLTDTLWRAALRSLVGRLLSLRKMPAALPQTAVTGELPLNCAETPAQSIAHAKPAPLLAMCLLAPFSGKLHLP